jgi:DNA-binding IclR family transcriptional regulator
VIRPSPQTDRVTTLISMLAQPGTALSLAEVCRRLNSSKSTCYSMMTSLSEQGWVTRDPTNKLYVIGPTMLDISRNASRVFPSLRLARPVMEELSFSLGVNCSALCIVDNHITVIDQVTDLRTVQDPYLPGVRIPLRPPFGVPFLCRSGPEAVERWLDTIPSERRAVVEGALRFCRDRGFLVERNATPSERAEATQRGSGSGEATLEALSEIMVSSVDEYHIVQWQPGDTYAACLIGAPVIGLSGEVEIVLTLSGFSEVTSGSRIEDMADALRVATASLDVSRR